jgi:hypothetical protein
MARGRGRGGGRGERRVRILPVIGVGILWAKIGTWACCTYVKGSSVGGAGG